jgi:phosphate starvation-inducible protein PhoH
MAKRKRMDLTLKTINPLTSLQGEAFRSFQTGQNLLLHGVAGTGKTFVALYLALNLYLENIYRPAFDKIHIMRSVVPTRSMGFLPGSIDEKIEVYESPYKSIFSELFGSADAYNMAWQKDIIEFTTTSYIRGETFSDCILVVDECQNMNLHELDSIITRLGDNSRIIFAGDFRQTDFKSDFEKNGILDFKFILATMELFDVIEFGIDDIVRSALVKDYIIAKYALGYA